MRLLRAQPLKRKGDVTNTSNTPPSSLPVWKRKATWLVRLKAEGN
jgi:hypothetical protein